MLKLFKNYSVLSDGTAFKYLALVPESIMLTGAGRIVLHNWRGLLRLTWRYRKVQLPASHVYVLAHNSFSGYYHWLLESLPKLIEAKKSLNGFVLLLPDTYTDSFYKETLAMLNITCIERMEPEIQYKVPQLAIPFFVEAMGHYSQATLKSLKHTVLNSIKIQATTAKLIYVSRKKALRRKIDNEQEVELFLIKHGFEIVCFEDYSFQETVQLCAGAEILLGIHGAGLANMVFVPESAIVIELRKFDQGENIFFEYLAQALELRYRLLYCQAINEGQSVQDADLQVDINDLKRVVREFVPQHIVE
ncbi:MAG: glycosyltransferase family 61 protein [Janthinobacterium lividum]